MIAYADESVRESPRGIYYVLGAAVLVDDPDTARAALRAMIPGKQQDRLHWRGERETRRLALLQTLSDLGIAVFASWAYPVRRHRQEHARSACLRVLAGDLSREGVSELVLEHRDEAGDRHDRQTLYHAQHSGTRRPPATGSLPPPPNRSAAPPSFTSRNAFTRWAA